MVTPDPGIGSHPQDRIGTWHQKRRVQELAALYAVAAAMNQALNEQEALGLALTRALELLQLDAGRIYLLDHAGHLSLIANQGNPDFIDPDEATVKLGECLCGRVTQDGEPQQSIQPGTGERLLRVDCRQHTGHACAAVPLLGKESTLGVLHVMGQRTGSFDAAEMALLRALGTQMGMAVENRRLREDARRVEALEALIQEMHHRIKNNLQTVADLLSLEMSASGSREARQSLRDSISRIKSIAAVHELLSLEHLRLTDISELAREVCDITLRQLTPPDRRVEAEINGSAIFLPSKQAIALALVMNELVSNAAEHAFADGQPGRVVINLEQEGPEIRVIVTDNGRGLPPDFDLNRTTGLGLQIVRTLVEKDLAGTLRVEQGTDRGSRATLTFYR